MRLENHVNEVIETCNFVMKADKENNNKLFLEAKEVVRVEAIKEFGQLLINKAEKGIIYAMDIPDYVIDFLNEETNEKL